MAELMLRHGDSWVIVHHQDVPGYVHLYPDTFELYDGPVRCPEGRFFYRKIKVVTLAHSQVRSGS